MPPAASALLKQRLERFTRVLPGVENGDVRSLHRARVASRRLRELLPVLRLEPDVSGKLGRRLRKVTRRLGTVRELDVLLQLIDDQQTARPAHRAALHRVGVAVGKARDDARKKLVAHLPSEEMWRLARKLERIAVDLKRHERERRNPARARSAGWVIDARIAHRAGRLDTAVRDAGAVYLPDRLHVVRIALKKLRYALELAPPSLPDRATALRTLKRVQELLGRMHDLQVLMERVREAQASLTPPSLGAWRELNELVIALEDMCRRLHARYVRERVPLEALTRRVGSTGAAARARGDRKVG